jgi:hypothetical protein
MEFDSILEIGEFSIFEYSTCSVKQPLKRHRFSALIILPAVRMYLRYPLFIRVLEISLVNATSMLMG